MEEKREEERKSKRSRIMANSVAFPDEIPMMMSGNNSSTVLSFPPPPAVHPSSYNNDQTAQNYCSSFAFMDLLALQDYSPSLFDWLPSSAAAVGSEVMASPSISWSSNEEGQVNNKNIKKEEPESSGKAGNEDEDNGSDAAAATATGEDNADQDQDPDKTTDEE